DSCSTFPASIPCSFCVSSPPRPPCTPPFPTRRSSDLIVESARQAYGHRNAVATDPGDQRRRLAEPNHRRLSVLERVEPPPAVVLHPLAPRELPHLGAPPKTLGAQQDEPVDDEEDRSDRRLRGGGPSGVLERQPEDPHRDAGDDDQPRKPLCRRVHPPLAQGAEERAH